MWLYLSLRVTAKTAFSAFGLTIDEPSRNRRGSGPGGWGSKLRWSRAPALPRGVVRWNQVNTPSDPILQKVPGAFSSVNQMLPSGPAINPTGVVPSAAGIAVFETHLPRSSMHRIWLD